MPDQVVRFVITGDDASAIAAFQETAAAAKASATEVSDAYKSASVDTTSLGAAAQAASVDTKAAMEDAATSVGAVGVAADDAAKDTKAALEDAASSAGAMGVASEDAAKDTKAAMEDAAESAGGFGVAAESAGKKTEDAMEDAGGSIVSVGKKAEDSGNKLGSVVSKVGGYTALALVGVAAASVKASVDFQQSMTLLETGAGQAASGIGAVKQGILGMAGAVGQTPEELAKGMYLIESAGYRGAAGLNVLKASAEGASVGNAQMATVADAVTTALTDYHMSASQAAEVTSALVETVASGKTNLEALGESLGKVMPTAAKLGITFQDVTGAIATMTNAGLSARFAATHLQNTLLALSSPSATATAALTSVGLTSQQVKNTLDGPEGLTGALQLIETHVGQTFPANSVASVTALKNIMGGVTGYSTALMLTGKSSQEFATNVKNIGTALGSTSVLQSGFNKIQGDAKFQLDSTKASVDSLSIEFGDVLLPKLEDVGHAVLDVTQYFEKHKTEAEVLAGVLGTVLVGAMGVWTMGLASNTTAMIGAVAPGTKFGQTMIGVADSLNVFGNASKAAQATIAKSMAQISADADAMAAEVKVAAGEADTALGSIGTASEAAAAKADIGAAGAVAAPEAAAAGAGTVASVDAAAATAVPEVEALGTESMLVAGSGGMGGLMVAMAALSVAGDAAGHALNKLANHGAGFGGGESAGQITSAQVEDMTAAQYKGYQFLGGKIDHLGTFVQGFMQSDIEKLQAAVAKDTSVQKQATTFQGMLEQLGQIKTQDGTSSTEYQQALKGIQSTADKWYPAFAKDKTAAQMQATMEQQYSQAVTESSKLDALTKDQTLKAAQTALENDLKMLSNEQKNGASEATQKATQGLINQELNHMAAIHAAQATIAKDTTSISNEKALEGFLGPKFGDVHITQLPTQKLSCYGSPSLAIR